MRLDSQLKVELHILLWRSQPNYTAAIILLYKQWPTCVPLCHFRWQIYCFSAWKFFCICIIDPWRHKGKNWPTGSLVANWNHVGQWHNEMPRLTRAPTQAIACFNTLFSFSWTIKMSHANFYRRHAWVLNFFYFPTEPILLLKSLVRHCGLCWLRLWGLRAVTQTEHRAGFILMLPEWSAPPGPLFLVLIVVNAVCMLKKNPATYISKKE